MRDRLSYLRTDLTAPDGPEAGKKRSGYPIITPSTFTDLARRVVRLAPHHCKPECFHEDQSKIVTELPLSAGEVQHG